MDFNNNGYHMDHNQNINNNNTGSPSYGYQARPPYAAPGQKLANAAMVLGIISVLSNIITTVVRTITDWADRTHNTLLSNLNQMSHSPSPPETGQGYLP